MSDTIATAPEANERPVSRNTLKHQIEDLRERAEGEQTTLAQLVELTQLKRDVEAGLLRVKKAIEPREEEVLRIFAERGEKSARDAASNKIAYINRRVWCRPAEGVDKAAAAEAMLADPDLSAFVEQGFNVTSLSAFFNEQAKELEAEGRPVTDDALIDLIPEPLRGVLALAPTYKVGVR